MYARLTPIEKCIIKLLPKKTYFQPLFHIFFYFGQLRRMLKILAEFLTYFENNTLKH